MQQQGRLTFLDCIRGIAAMAVMIEHTGTYVFSSKEAYFTHQTFSIGKFGVTLFFLASGFVIPLSLEKGGSLKRFWVHRVCRLYPLYWFSLIAAVLLYLWGLPKEVQVPFSQHLLRNTLINITMFQEFARIPHAIALYYTLTIEMAFYISCSVLLITNLLRRAYLLCWVVLLLCLVTAAIFPLTGHGRVPMAGLFYIWTLSVGMVLFNHMKGRVSGAELLSLLGAGIVGQAWAVYLNYVWTFKVTEQFTFIAVFGSWFGAYALFGTLYLLRASRFPPLFVWLGQISYSIYLLHPVVMCLFPSSTESVLTLAAIDLGTIVLAAITFRFIEKPFIDFGVRLGKRFNATSAAVPSSTPARPATMLHTAP